MYMKLYINMENDGCGYVSHKLVTMGFNIIFDDVSGDTTELIFHYKGNETFIINDENFIKTFKDRFYSPNWKILED